MKIKRFLALLLAASLAASLSGTALAVQPDGKSDDRANTTDNLPGDLAKKQAALKERAQAKVLKGEAKAVGKNKVVKLAKGQYVELAFEGEDQIFTLLGEFGPNQNNAHPGHPAHGGTPGPSHNQIPEPDRAVDNSTIWTEDFSQAHYDDLLYSKGTNPSMANWYLEQSSGTYSVDGYVSDWVQVPDNSAAYGSNYCGSIVCTRDIGRFMTDQGNAWYAEMLATKTAAEIDAMLAPFDIWDRYDYDGDGDFDESDGYIDHFQSVHAGIGEETCSPDCSDAIWSHRSYANAGPQGAAGPTVDGNVVPLGGMRLGSSSYWVGDYTIEPENGGVGVFSHEFAHDLGLPDLYDTSGNTGGAENSTAWWTIMSQGSYGSVNGEDIGSAPVHFGAWEKFQLGFLKDFEVAGANGSGTFHLGPAEYNTKKAQAMFIVLPELEVPLELGAPCEGCGTSYFYSGSGDGLNNTMTRTVAAGGALTAKVRYDIEPDFDYAFLEASTDGGTTWLPITTNLSEPASGDASGLNSSGTGWSGDSGGVWIDLTGTVPAGTNAVRFRYNTDAGLALPGFQVDNIAIDGTLVGTAESDEGWAFNGFRITTGSETQSFFNAYVLENRQYIGYDMALKLGPYNFGFPDDPNLLEHFPLQDGLLVSYWNSSFTDNNVGDHPGEGLILPVDSHPQIELWSDGTQMRPRLQSYDSTFTTKKTDAITVHDPVTGVAKTIASKPAVSVFDDSRSYWTSGHPSDAPADGRYQAEWNSVNVPNAGVVVRVKSISGSGMLVLDLNR